MQHFEGTVIRVDSRQAVVDRDGEPVSCHLKGSLFRGERRFSRPIAVGDRVIVEVSSTPPPTITEVLPRRNFLSRNRASSKREQVLAANLDQAVLVQSCHDPELNLRLLDRLLVGAEHSGFTSLIVLNKIDLVEDQSALDVVDEIYAPLGYRILRTSVVTRDGLDALAAALTGQTSVIAGLSGVGKSALLTAVQPGLALRSEGVSQATGKGKHTTTAATLLQLKGGGYVVDTPGIREFLPAGLNPAELGHHWPEFRSLLTGCRFKNCLHNREVGCAVQDAAESEVIHPHRYDSYLRILESLLEE